MKTNVIFSCNVADEICNKTIWNKCQIYSLSISMRLNFFILQQLLNIEKSRFRKHSWLQLEYKLLYPSLASYYLHDTSLLMSWRNIIFTFFSNLFKLMGTRRALPDSRRCFHAFLRQRSTTLSISGTSVCIAERKRVNVILNICCKIATETYLIWLAD